MNFSSDIYEIQTILKMNTDFDKHLLPLLKFGHFLFGSNQKVKSLSLEKYNGTHATYTHFVNSEDKLTKDYIMMGVNALEKKNFDIYEDLYKIFDKDEQKMTSFIFFHEVGHKIGHTLNQQKENEKKIVYIFEKDKNMKLSEKDKEIISTQYSETFADSFAIQAMIKKYPDLDFEKTKSLISGMRMTGQSPTHMTSPGLTELKKLNSDASIEEIINNANNSSLITTQFYSNVEFTTEEYKNENVEKRAAKTNLVPLDTNQVRKNIVAAKEKFIEKFHKSDKPLI